MLSFEKFNNADLDQIKKIPKTIFLTTAFLLLACIPLSFLFGLVGLLKKGHGYWPTTISFLLFFILVAIFSTLRDYIKYKKDVLRQIKLTGNIIVKNKSVKKGEYIINTDSSDLKKVNLIFAESFNKIETGDQLYIEISKYSKTILRLLKNQESLIKELG